MRSYWLLACLLSGCAQLATEQTVINGCQGTVEPTASALQQAAFYCLEQGDATRAQVLLDHPEAGLHNQDYHAYLKAYSGYLQLYQEADLEKRLQAIRRNHREYVSWVKRYPQSQYLTHVKAQLYALHRLAAQSEYDAALALAAQGQHDRAHQQMLHITRHYRHGEAIQAAEQWLANQP